jgi:hypothetical protein
MSNTLERKLDLLLSLHQDHNVRLKKLEEKISPTSVRVSKWISCSELGKLVGIQGGSIRKYIHRGKFPKEILKKKPCGKSYSWRILSEEGLKIAEEIRMGVEVDS